MDSDRSFPMMSILKIVLLALESLRHMLDFTSNVFRFGLG